MAFCKKCGAQLGEGDLFCDACGGKQENKSMEPVAHAPPAAPPVYNQTVYNPPVYTPPTGGGQAMPKKPSWAMISIISVLLVALIIVGSLYGVGTGKLSKANSDITGLQTQLTTANGEVTSLTSDLAAANTKVTTLTADLATANGKVTTLTADLATANGKVTSITADLATANGKVTSITSDLAVANGKVTTLTASLATANGTATSLQTQLSAIQAKYPLKDFPDYATLNTWVKAHTQIYSATETSTAWYVKALKVQSLAAADGYYVSAVMWPGSTDTSWYVENEVLAGTTLYWFDPEIGTLVSYYTVSR